MSKPVAIVTAASQGMGATRSDNELLLDARAPSPGSATDGMHPVLRKIGHFGL
jgi:hypothetical protein